MITPKKLQKRSWSPFYNKDGKWFTGYYGGYPRDSGAEDRLHEVRTLKLTPDRTYPGRSASNMIFRDEEGSFYSMTLKGGMDLVKRLISKDIEYDGIYLITEFMQVKKGANLFIEVYEE